MKIWLADLTHDQQVVAADTMPTNVAFLAAYVSAMTHGAHEFRLFKYPGKLISAIESEELPDIVGFSNFIWNSNLSLGLTERIRSRKPNISVVFGGLHYPSDQAGQERWLGEHPEVDFYVHKEGENGLLNLVKVLANEDGDRTRAKREETIEGVHFRREDGSFHITPPAPRVGDLASFPSPYLTGMLDEFFDGRLMPVLTTNRGCPFTCTFCSEGLRYYTKVNRSSSDRVAAEIEYIGSRSAASIEKLARRDLYISDSNFGMFKEDLEVARLLAETKRKYGWPQYIQTTTGKNSKERVLTVAQLLEGSLRLSGSVQSLDPAVQRNIRRSNIRADDLLDVAMKAGEVGANSYSEVILALPGDSYRAHEASVEKIINARYDFVLPWQLVLLPDTEVASAACREQYSLQTKFRVLTKSYGVYEFTDEEPLAVFETEEVCIGGDALTFEDYLRAREFNLVVTVFYNDRFMGCLLRVLDHYGVPRFDWVRRVAEEVREDAALYEVFERFREETKDELWADERSMRAEFDSPDIVRQLVDGDRGGNLLAKYRIELITEHLPAIVELARRSLVDVLGPRVEAEILPFIDEVSQFELETIRDFFNPDLGDSIKSFHYDILQFIEHDVEPKLCECPTELKFIRASEAAAMLRRNLELFGTSTAGLYKSMTRMSIKTLYRDAHYTQPASSG